MLYFSHRLANLACQDCRLVRCSQGAFSACDQIVSNLFNDAHLGWMQKVSILNGSWDGLDNLKINRVDLWIRTADSKVIRWLLPLTNPNFFRCSSKTRTIQKWFNSSHDQGCDREQYGKEENKMNVAFKCACNESKNFKSKWEHRSSCDIWTRKEWKGHHGCLVYLSVAHGKSGR